MNHERYISGRDFVGRRLLEDAAWPIQLTYYERIKKCLSSLFF